MKRLFIYWGVLASLLMFMITGCSNDSPMESKSTDSAQMDTASGASLNESAAMATEASKGIEKNLKQTDRKVIYTADLSLEVKDYHQTNAFIQQYVESVGGYVIESNVSANQQHSINGTLIVRIPQTHFYSFIHDLESENVQLKDRHISGQDVTEEFVDLESRLRSKRVVEDRLIGFMENAETTEDLLNISKELSIVQEEIEQITGRMNYLQNHVDLSTVSIYMTENNVTVSTLQSNETLDTWAKSKSLFMDTVNGIVSFFSSVIVLFIGLSPLLFIVGTLTAVLLLRRRKNRMRDM